MLSLMPSCESVVVATADEVDFEVPTTLQTSSPRVITCASVTDQGQETQGKYCETYLLPRRTLSALTIKAHAINDMLLPIATKSKSNH
jgi:hypothetical protein